MRQPTNSALGTLLPNLQEREQLPQTDLILCQFCRAAITSKQDSLIVGGHHQHRFLNPNGLNYSIGCFKVAPGCDISGPAINDFTWFKHHSWQLARCSDCGEHLGWFYQHGETSQFFGLIIDKLRYPASAE